MVEQQNRVRDFCAEFRPVIPLCMQALRSCTVAQATFLFPKYSVPVDKPPYHSNPRTVEAIEKCVKDMLEWKTVEERPNAWGSPS